MHRRERVLELRKSVFLQAPAGGVHVDPECGQRIELRLRLVDVSVERATHFAVIEQRDHLARDLRVRAAQPA